MVGTGEGGLPFRHPGRRNRAGLRIFWRPVFRRKSHAPERRARFGKLEADFRFARAHGAEENHVTLLFFLGPSVLQHHFTSAGHAGTDQDQGAVSVDGQRFSFFFEGMPLRVRSTNPDGDLHQHTLAAAAHRGCPRSVRGLYFCHSTSLG